MKKAPVIVGIAIAALTIGAIAISSNAQYQKKKEAARREAEPLRISCALKANYEERAAFARRSYESDPSNETRKETAREMKEQVDLISAECKRVRDYEIKYDDVIERSTH